MTVIRPNSISGVTSITAQANEINVFKHDGVLAGLQLNGVNHHTSSGVSTFHTLNVLGNVSVGGTLTYEDVTNVDSVGIITARSTIDAQGDVSIADKIIHTGDTNTALRFPAADTFTVETGGSERARIDSNGFVGIKETSPHLYYSPDLVVKAAAENGGITIRSAGTTHNNYLMFADGNSGDSRYDGYIKYNHNSRQFDFATAATTRLSITSEGQVKLTGSNSGNHMSTFGTNVGGLTIDDVGQNHTGLQVSHGSNNVFLVASSNNSAYLSSYGTGNMVFELTGGGGTRERLRIDSNGRFGFNTSSPSAYARVHVEDENGILLAGNSQSRILLRKNNGGTNQKMMDIVNNGDLVFRTINDDYTTATARAAFRSDGNFVVGNRVGLSAPSTNQPVAFHSARVTPDGNPRRVSTGQRCNLFVGSNSGWAAHDGGTLGLGGSETGGAGVEAMWSYLKGARQSGNGWEYAGYFELGTSPWSGTNMAKRVKIYADGQIEIYPTDNTFFSTQIGGAQRLIMEHTGGGNIRMRNTSSGTVTYQTSSDYRLKENVVNITNALTTVKALKPYEYKWKHDGKLGQGFFAHEAQETLPDIGIVSGTKDGVHTEDPVKDEHHKKGDPIYQSIDYSKLVPLLTAALQEETAKREALEARVAALEGS